MRSLVFLHNPKAGGTSITSFLKSLFPPGEVAPTLESSPGARSPEGWVPHRSRRFVAGHFGHEVREAHFPGHGLISNFRHPVARIHSLYQFWRHVPDSQLANLPAVSGPGFARTMSFGEFIRSEDPFLSLYLENFHARQLLKSGWLWWKCDGADLEAAKGRVESMDWFYVCELPALSLSWLRAAFPDEAIPESFPKLNEGGGHGGGGPTWREAGIVASRNRLDMELYREALRVMEARAAG